jgi:hypothetical protein
METKFDIGEEVYLKCKVLGIHAHKSCGTSYTLTLPEGNAKLDTICLESDLEKIPEAQKTKDYNITLTVPNVTYKRLLSIYDKLESVMTDIVGSKDWGISGGAIGEEKDDGNEH